jgi:hypothetical protein
MVAVATAVNTYYSRRTEQNTNSMKDALVAKTAEASHAQGEAKGRADLTREQKGDDNA